MLETTQGIIRHNMSHNAHMQTGLTHVYTTKQALCELHSAASLLSAYLLGNPLAARAAC